MSEDWICTECGDVEPSYEQEGGPPFCPQCGVELSPADRGVLKQAELKSEGENDLADAIREAIGADPGETVEVVTPQFDRVDDVSVDWTPDDTMDVYGLTDADDDRLKELGLQRWSDDLWLFPAEWYDHIPDGTMVETINGEVEEFQHGETSDDRRFGALAYGIRNGENAP